MLKAEETTMEKTLVLMRHGETLFNAMHKIRGWCDSPLTQRGIEQAKAAGKKLWERGFRFDHAYSSTSERCCDTLELVCDLPYTRLKGLKENNYGLLEGESDFLAETTPSVAKRTIFNSGANRATRRATAWWRR